MRFLDRLKIFWPTASTIPTEPLPTESFKTKIEQELEGLTREQRVRFAWRCGVRALPILGHSGNFDFWREKRQNHIYAVFYALDYAYAAAYAAYADAAAKVKINLESILISDLNAVQVARPLRWEGGGNQEKPADLYGEVWDCFQKALEAEGCGYWGRLYQKIFDDGLVSDPVALQRRMNVPSEIRTQGAAAVAHYLEELEKGAERLNEARIIILGDKGAGKTCIARRLIDPKAPMTTEQESTAGVDTTLWKLEKENLHLRIWDFAGHVVTHAVHQFFLSERCLYLVVYNGRTEEPSRLEYWLNHMKNYGGNSEAMILINKRDPHSVEIPIHSLKEKYPIAGVYTFSIKDDAEDLEKFRSDVASYVKNHPSWKGQEIPQSFYQVKNEIEQLFVKGKKEKGREYIEKGEFDRIAQKHDASDVELLLQDLHFLGVSLWYKDLERYDTLVLNPEWISHGVYKIINWVHEAKRYGLTLNDFATVFKADNRYPKEKYPFLFELMKHYQLAYETGKGLIIPHLLKEDRPERLPDFPPGESLMARYEARQPLPPHSISRFIVRHHQEIKEENKTPVVWRYGVVLEDENRNVALVREDDRTLSISVKGEGKTAYMSRLRETLNDIFNSYKSEKPELQYRIERFGQIPDEADLWLSGKTILNYSNKNRSYYDDDTDQNIPMEPIRDKYHITAENVIFGGEGHRVIRDQSTHTAFNFYNCNIGLQGNLNGLAQLFSEGGHKEEAEELTRVATALKQVKNAKDPEEVKESGMFSRIKRWVDNLGDEKSSLHKTVEGMKYGISLAQDIAQGYNDIAQWAGLPQVPKPFLKKG
jgi:GTPase SAR1 family protein